MISTKESNTMRRTLTAALVAALAVPSAAAAHVTATPDTAPAEGYAAFTLRVGHGCEASPTTKVTVQMPDQVVSATPEVVPGWKITTKEGPLAQPFDSHGETVTEGVREVSWTGGPLDAHQYTEFGLSVRFAGEPGDAVPFKTIQTCEEGENAWIEIPVEGEAEPESPAPIVTLEGADAETEPVADTAAPAASVSADDGGPSTGLVVVALVLGALGTLAGGAALIGGRRRTS